MKKSLFAMTVVLLTACAKSTDLYEPENNGKDAAYQEELTKAEYTANFSMAYPTVNLNQSWDYANKNPQFSLPSNTKGAGTRAGGYTIKEGEDYEVDNNTLNWMKSKLVEAQNNKAQGVPFYMSVPNNSFTIVPIYQGKASLIWELHMVVGDTDMKIWEKSQNLWVKQSATADWKEVGSLSNTEYNKYTISSYAVKATPYTFENLPVGEQIYFYLKVTESTETKYDGFVGAEQSSLNAMMLAMNVDEAAKPTNIPEGSEVMIIGCEDLTDDYNQKSDWDYNDVVFMVYGKPDVPKPVVIEEGDPVVQKKTVRYMIEDLGSTDDFDFNDIVVDVSDITTQTPIYTNGVFTGWKETGEARQEAVIRHLGGTLPFQLKIGDTTLPEMGGQSTFQTSPNTEFTVKGWDINAHNISVQVKQKENETVYYNVKFPKAGEAPMIIAVEPTQEWMSERKSVPADWFTE